MTDDTPNAVDRAALTKMAAEASDIQEFLIDAKIGISSDRRLIIDFVLDNYVPKMHVDSLVQSSFKDALDLIIPQLMRICYRRTGSTELGDQILRELRETLKEITL